MGMLSVLKDPIVENKKEAQDSKNSSTYVSNVSKAAAPAEARIFSQNVVALPKRKIENARI